MAIDNLMKGVVQGKSRIAPKALVLPKSELPKTIESVKLMRIAQKGDATLSVLIVDDVPVCLILEPKLRTQKVKGSTCIPEGSYTLKLNTTGDMNKKYINHSDADIRKIHRGMIEITGIPNYQFVYFHTGNILAHTKACGLTGADIRIEDDGNFGLYESTVQYKRAYIPIRDKIEINNGQFPIQVINGIYLKIENNG
jgi:hypothetical protein